MSCLIRITLDVTGSLCLDKTSAPQENWIWHALCRATFEPSDQPMTMYIRRSLLALPFALALTLGSTAQNSLDDGTSLVWDKEINASTDSLQNDSNTVPAYSVPVYEATASQVNDLLKTVLPGSVFKKQGKLMKANSVTFTPASSTPVDVLALATQDKKQGLTTLSLAFLNSGTSIPVDNPALSSAVRDLGVSLNKAVVQQQVDAWTKQLDKAGSKSVSATKSHDKAQSDLVKAQNEVDKNAKEKQKLQDEHAILQKEVDLYNQKWTLNQDPKDLKKLNKARSEITKNGEQMAKVVANDTKAQKELTKSSANIPDVQQEKDEQAAAQADAQRTLDALKQKLGNIR